jgi:hypothetical protein
MEEVFVFAAGIVTWALTPIAMKAKNSNTAVLHVRKLFGESHEAGMPRSPTSFLSQGVFPRPKRV